MKILVVEDSKVMRRLIRSIVGDVAEVLECEDGSQALGFYEKHRPDWVLMDIRMQNVGGIEATRLIIAAHSDARVVIVTNCNDNRFRERARVAGACDYVLKEDLSALKQILTAPL